MVKIIAIREHPEYLDEAADYFSSKWGIERQIYEASITDSLQTELPTPRWYLMLEDSEISGSYGVIENDFMIRKDLTPWLCALYVEKSKRQQGLGGKLLEHARIEASKLGFSDVYLCTDHEHYYEQYNWQFLGLSESGFDGLTRIYQISSLIK